MLKHLHRMGVTVMALVLCTMILLQGTAWAANDLYDENTAYILNPPTLPEEPKTAHEFINILMLGVDYGVPTSGRGKEDIKNCHTDSVILIAVDVTDNRVNIISIPRDTLTYVPGVYGVYKLNAAINCAESFKEGIKTTEATVSWLLGGIRPDYYVLITPTIVQKIGDVIGGLDIDVEMSYTGNSGRRYERGLQHLDGVGIMDYARARKNATRNNDDWGRSSRQRQVLTALFGKVQNDPNIAYDVLDTLVENFDKSFFSDMSVATLMDMMPVVDSLADGTIRNYVMDGELTMAMLYFNSNFFDQAKRQEIIREVYGVEIPQQRLNSKAYLNYLFKYGFTAVKAIRVATQVIDWAQQAGYQGKELQAALTARQEAIAALSAITDKVESNAVLVVDRKTNALKQAIAALRKASGHPENISWRIVRDNVFNEDPYINQYYEIDWS